MKGSNVQSMTASHPSGRASVVRWALHLIITALVVISPVAAQSSTRRGSTAGKSTAKAAARAPEVSPALFLNSNPIGAVVILDGRTIPARTPMLFRGLKPGGHRIEIAKKGYSPYYGKIQAVAGKPTTVTIDLKPRYIAPVFGPASKVMIDGKRANYAKTRYRLPPGQYRLASRNGVVSIVPTFPDEQIMRATDLATGALLTASAILIAESILDANLPGGAPNTSNTGNYTPVWVISGFSLVSDLFLHVQKARYLKAYAANPVPIESSAGDAQHLYEKGQSALASSDLSAAAHYYIRIVRHDSSSLYFPRALYQLGKIHAIEGDDLLATAEFRLILEHYPMADLYDRTCKSLADLNYRAGNYREALSYLDKMVFIDPIYTRKEISAYRAEIEKRLAQKGAGS